MKHCRICGRELKSYEAQMKGIGHVCESKYNSKANKDQVSIFDVNPQLEVESWIDRVINKFLPCLDFATQEQIDNAEQRLRAILKNEKK